MDDVFELPRSLVDEREWASAKVPQLRDCADEPAAIGSVRLVSAVHLRRESA